MNPLFIFEHRLLGVHSLQAKPVFDWNQSSFSWSKTHLNKIWSIHRSFLKIIPSNHLPPPKSSYISLKSSDHPSKESGTIESPYQGFMKVLQYTTRHPFLNTATRTDNSTFLNSWDFGSHNLTYHGHQDSRTRNLSFITHHTHDHIILHQLSHLTIFFVLLKRRFIKSVQ